MLNKQLIELDLTYENKKEAMLKFGEVVIKQIDEKRKNEVKPIKEVMEEILCELKDLM